MFFFTNHMKKQAPHRSLWRNRSARSAVNREDGGSSPPRDGWWFFTCLRDVAAYLMSVFFCHLSTDLFIMPVLLLSSPCGSKASNVVAFPLPQAMTGLSRNSVFFFKRELDILDNTEYGQKDFINVIRFH